MKTFIALTIVIAFIFLSVDSFAQTRTDRIRRHDVKSPIISSEKVAQITDVQNNYKADLQAVMRDSTIRPDIQRELMRTLMMERNQKLRGILNLEPHRKENPLTEKPKSL